MFEDLQTAHHVAPHAFKGVLELAVARMGRGIGLQLPRLKSLVAGGRVDAINPAIAGLIRGNGELATEFYQGRYVLLGAVDCILRVVTPDVESYERFFFARLLQPLVFVFRENPFVFQFFQQIIEGAALGKSADWQQCEDCGATYNSRRSFPSIPPGSNQHLFHLPFLNVAFARSADEQARSPGQPRSRPIAF